MRFLDNPELDLLARALNFEAPGVRVASRVEAYTIKPLARDRALFKRLDAELLADIDLDAPERRPLQPKKPTIVPLHDSAFGPLERRENRKTLWLLIGTLNLAYPDHDFSNLTAIDFVREQSARAVLVQLSTALGHLRHAANPFVASSSPPKYSASYSSLSSSAGSGSDDEASTPSHPVLRQVLDPIINLDDCEVYSYSPDFESDPHNGESDSEDEAAAGESDDDEGGDGLAWSMDGVPCRTPTMRPHRRARVPSGPSPNLPRGVSKRSRSAASLGEPTGGLLWSSNYFFLNRKRKRLLFISLWARSHEGPSARWETPVAAAPPLKRHKASVA